MISNNLIINSADLNHRNCAGYYFARWFDESFCVDVLNLLSKVDNKYQLADDNMDQQHCDYTFVDINGLIKRCDSKTVTKNFGYSNSIDSSKAASKDYCDVITIGEYVLSSVHRPDIISFYYRGRIFLIDSGRFANISPISITESEGENKHKQNLFHYRVDDIIKEDVNAFEVPEAFSRIYDSAYKILEQTRNFILEMPRATNDAARDYNKKVRLQSVERMKDSLISYINEFNNAESSYRNQCFVTKNVVSNTSISDNLSEIYDLLN